jgi:methionyl-tRNA formyltransferase
VLVQPEGKAPMPFDAWRNGARPSPDELFGDL